MLKRSPVNSLGMTPGNSLPQISHCSESVGGTVTTPLSADRPHKNLSVSNLTRNLMSSSSAAADTQYTHGLLATQTATPNPSFTRQPPSYSASVAPHSNFIPAVLFGAQHYHTNSGSSPYNHGHHHFINADPSMPLFTPPTGTMNYVPLGPNTPTAMPSSYTSSHSFTPSFPGSNVCPNDGAFHTQLHPPSTFALSGSYKMPGGPTTNICLDSANPHLLIHRDLLSRSSFSCAPSGNIPNNPYVRSLPNSFAESSSCTAQPSQQTLEKIQSDRLTQQPQDAAGNTEPQHPIQPDGSGDVFKAFNELVTTDAFTGPGHYMSYKEFFQSLNQEDADSKDDDESGYEEHLNIVEYPVDQLTTMLACLLTKITEANDKLHPNHFDSTIVAGQKLKDHKKIRRMEKEQSQHHESSTYARDGIRTIVSNIAEGEHSDGFSEDEEDELKNKYLANVLAFHGTNVPGITLHAYLTRVLKYCPVTNEVFLSLLVYFDRIAKRANNFQSKNSTPGEDSTGKSEQIFVMDSFIIHRLIILGITVSSKFFSDIFYKNLRYAKVGGLPLEELNYLELQFLLLLDFKLMISVEDLQNYGDLLLKFWKREQLATEVIQGSGNT